MTPAQIFRERIASGRTLWKGTVWDGLTARLCANAGFDLLTASGYNIASSMGIPDVGITSLAEVLNSNRIIQRAVPDAPVIADIDTGYGNAVNVMRTVREFEAIGVAGVQIEDQVFPKRCPYLGATPVIPLDEAVNKIRAAVEARKGDMVISARTDANTIEETIVRGRAYIEAGADMVFVIAKYAVRNLDDAKRLKKEFGNIPLAFSVYDWHYENATPEDYANLGGVVLGAPFAAITTAAQALKGYYQSMMEHHDIRKLAGSMMSVSEFETLVGMDEVNAIQDKYLPKD